MLILDETPYEEQKDILQAAPTGIAKAAGMAALKLPVGIAGAAVLIEGSLDRMLFGDETRFKTYEEDIKPIQEALTPDPGSVSNAGRFISGIAGFAPALALGPAGVLLLAGQSAINTGAELVDQGVKPEVATGAAVLVGATGAAMAGLPTAGKTWGKTLALASLNPVLGAASTEAEKKLLESTGYGKLAESYDPFDPVARGIDATLGLAFGAMGKYSEARREMLTKTKDSIDTMASWQRMFKDTPFDITDLKTADLGYKAMQKALADISVGKPVDLSGVVPDEVPLKTPATPIRAEAAEAKKTIEQSIAEAPYIGDERRRLGDILRKHIDDLSAKVAQGDQGAREELYKTLMVDKVSNAHTQRAFEIVEKLEGQAQFILSTDVKGLHAIDTHLGQQAGDNYLRLQAQVFADEGLPVFRYGENSDEFLSRFNTWQDANEAKKRVDNRFRNSILEVPQADGTSRYFTNIEFYSGIGGHYGEKNAHDNAFDKLYAAKRVAKADPGYNREALPANLVELSREEFNARQKAGWSEVPPAAERPAAVAKTSVFDRTFSDHDKAIAEELHSIIKQSAPEVKIGGSVDIRDEQGDRTGERYVETSNLPKHLRNQGITRTGSGNTLDLLDRVVNDKPLTGNQKLKVADIIDHHSGKMGYDVVIDDPVARRMEEYFAKEGDFPIHTGTDALGAPTSISAREFIQQAKNEYKALEAQKDIYGKISDCL